MDWTLELNPVPLNYFVTATGKETKTPLPESKVYEQMCLAECLVKNIGTR